MIRSKIDARERALELAVELCKGFTGSDELVVKFAENFESYLRGDTDLPELSIEDMNNILSETE